MSPERDPGLPVPPACIALLCDPDRLYRLRRGLAAPRPAFVVVSYGHDLAADLAALAGEATRPDGARP